MVTREITVSELIFLRDVLQDAESYITEGEGPLPEEYEQAYEILDKLINYRETPNETA